MQKIFMFLTLLFVVCACEQQELVPLSQEGATLSHAKQLGLASFDPERAPIAVFAGGKLDLLIPAPTLLAAFKAANSNIETLDSYEFTPNPFSMAQGDVPYLVAYVSLKDQSRKLIALDLATTDGIHYHVDYNTGGNSCSGFCCSKCQWSRPQGSPYYVCWCISVTTTPSCGEGAEARCDHQLDTHKGKLIQAVN